MCIPQIHNLCRRQSSVPIWTIIPYGMPMLRSGVIHDTLLAPLLYYRGWLRLWYLDCRVGTLTGVNVSVMLFMFGDPFNKAILSCIFILCTLLKGTNSQLSIMNSHSLVYTSGPICIENMNTHLYTSPYLPYQTTKTIYMTMKGKIFAHLWADKSGYKPGLINPCLICDWVACLTFTGCLSGIKPSKHAQDTTPSDYRGHPSSKQEGTHYLILGGAQQIYQKNTSCSSYQTSSRHGWINLSEFGSQYSK